MLHMLLPLTAQSQRQLDTTCESCLIILIPATSYIQLLVDDSSNLCDWSEVDVSANICKLVLNEAARLRPSLLLQDCYRVAVAGLYGAVRSGSQRLDATEPSRCRVMLVRQMLIENQTRSECFLALPKMEKQRQIPQKHTKAPFRNVKIATLNWMVAWIIYLAARKWYIWWHKQNWHPGPAGDTDQHRFNGKPWGHYFLFLNQCSVWRSDRNRKDKTRAK